MWILRIIGRFLKWFGLSMDLKTLWGILGSSAMTLGAILLLRLSSWFEAQPLYVKSLLILVLLLSFLVLIAHIADAVKWRWGKIEFVPSSGPSPKIRLGIKNKGRPRKFWAQCTPLVSRNDPNPLTTGTFDLVWMGSADAKIEIVNEETQEILIALFTLDHNPEWPHGEFQIIRRGPTEHVAFIRAVWNINRSEQTPEFDLEIRLFMTGVGKPKIKRFTLLVEKPWGPAKLIEVDKE